MKRRQHLFFSETVYPFNRLKASFQALTALMEGNCNENELNVIENFFDDQMLHEEGVRN